MVVIYRQEIINDISLFTSQPKAAFYDELFLKLDLSFVPLFSNSKGRKGFDNHSMIAAFIVMKCEGFAFITDLIDYLNNNLLIALTQILTDLLATTCKQVVHLPATAQKKSNRPFRLIALSRKLSIYFAII